MNPSAPGTKTLDLWRRLAALVLIVAALGIPINDLFRYALLIVAVAAVFSGTITDESRRWAAACVAIVVVILARMLMPEPRIDEGHNVFIVDGGGGALERGLPANVFVFMRAEFDRQYPPERRCDRNVAGCWRGQPFPDRAFAFSADGIFERGASSRWAGEINFDDANWLRLGFVNDANYNWNAAVSDVERATRLRGLEAWRHPWRAVFHPWRLTMPWFVTYRLPAELAGSRLCWTGSLLWEGPAERFAAERHAEMKCRTIAAADAGRRVFGVAIAQDAPLAMQLEPTLAVKLRQLIAPVGSFIGAFAVLALVLNVRGRALVLSLALMASALVVALLVDATFVGGWRPYDSGDDGLAYESMARKIAQYVMAGDFLNALRGEESVYYYGGPGFRYLRALERFVFGDSTLGYLTLMLAFPAFALALFRRFLSADWALALIVMFVVIPIGAIFGSSYFQYLKWAARGFADPAAAVFLVWGLVVLLGRSRSGSGGIFASALGAGFLLFLAVFVRPNLFPVVGVMLAGAGIAALWQAQLCRLTGLCLGFLPVLSMMLHNWYFGGVFVPLSSNITTSANFPTPPAIYLAALGEIARLDFGGADLARVLVQIGGWLSGPSESLLTSPVNIAGVAVLVHVLICRRGFEPWLRLLAGAVLTQHAVALFYPTGGRYHYVTWLLTLLVGAAWLQAEGLGLIQRACPRLSQWFIAHPITIALAHALDWCVRMSELPRDGEKISAAT